MAAMENPNITAAIFAAHLNCSTKAYLTVHGERPPDLFLAETRGRISVAYKTSASQHLRSELSVVVPLDFVHLADTAAPQGTIFLVDCETAFYACNDTAASARRTRIKRRKPGCEFVPILYSAWDKSGHFDELLVCFGALAIGQATGDSIPQGGKIVYGANHRVRTVTIANNLPKTLQLIQVIASYYRTAKPPPLLLNKHCPTCEFRSRCHALAVERDDLSLLGAMTAKERTKCHDKGISTITQLSYGYRPRRRRRIKPTPAPGSPAIKHDHKLKALAIKKGRTHVVGSPSLSIEGTPVFMDVESLPDRDFYYLIGLRYEMKGLPVQHSLWANGPEDEREIWQSCIRILREIDNPCIVHYGAYEARFLKLMKWRWKPLDEDADFLDRIVDGSVNLLAVMYGKIYLPTYSNGLKEVARWLGVEWKWQQASGSAAILLRRCWELTGDDELRRTLIEYNIDDCRGAAVVCESLTYVCGNGKATGAVNLETVNVASLEVPFQRTFGKFPSALPEFERINKAAYWDYQRSRVYVRTNKTIRRSLQKKPKRIMIPSVEKEILIDDRPPLCPKCGSSKLWVRARLSHVVFDLRYMRRGISRWAVRYQYSSYRCGACQAQMTLHPGRGTKYGQNLRAYIVYLLIEMRLSHQKIREHVATVFNIAVGPTASHDTKAMMAEKYEPTYQGILDNIASGPLVHADETKGVVYGGGHYVWIFANLTSVAYVYSASREASLLNDILKGFSGVLVSDFYGGYDSVPCRQQKCLIHLMRDLNEEVLKHPFNEELTFVAQAFGGLLRGIVETIDRYGLKKHYLRKHKRSAEQFLNDIARLQCATEAGRALQKRIDKNSESLFTFLDFDNVPWNNNNAEHAVRAFTRLRNVMITSTPKGTKEYCILLSVQQTLRYRGLSFLEFLRSGRIEIDLPHCIKTKGQSRSNELHQ